MRSLPFLNSTAQLARNQNGFSFPLFSETTLQPSSQHLLPQSQMSSTAGFSNQQKKKKKKGGRFLVENNQVRMTDESICTLVPF